MYNRHVVLSGITYLHKLGQERGTPLNLVKKDEIANGVSRFIGLFLLSYFGPPFTY